MLGNSVLLIGIFVGLSLSAAHGDQGTLSHVEGVEWRLLNTLFTNYSKNQRPSTTVNVAVNLVVTNLDSVDPKRERIGLHIWFRMFWMDNRMQWDLSQYNITSLTVNFDEVWTPDMMLYSAVGSVRDFGIPSDDGLNMNVIIYSDGTVFFSQRTFVQSACAINIADFPFDDQVCELTFGSWSMDYTLLQQKPWKGGIDLTDFTKNNMWDLLHVSVKTKDQLYLSHESPFSVLVYTIAVRRKALFFVVNYILPPVAISFLSLLLFLIPPEVGKRMEAGINLLLCLSVYLLLVNSKMPSTSTAFPLLTKFYGCAIIILVLAMCCTCLVYALYFMNSSGLELHAASVALTLKDCVLRWLKPLLFGCSCGCRLTAKLRRGPSKVHALETDSRLSNFDNNEQDKGSDEKQSKDEKGAASSLEPPVIITNNSRDFHPRTSVANSQDPEGHLALTKRSSTDIDSSISSIVSFKSEEDGRDLLTRVYFTSSAETITMTGDIEERKKVTFAFQENVGVKRRSSFRKCDGQAAKQTEHTLISQAGSSWFSQMSWEDSQENENHAIEKHGKDVSGQLHDEVNESKALDLDASEKKSTSDNQVPDLLDQIVLTFDARNAKSRNTQQWQKAATVLDRMFIIVLFTSIFVSFLTCLLLAPRVRQYFIP